MLGDNTKCEGKPQALETCKAPSALPYDFEYFQPTSVRDALFLLSKYQEKARIIAGGTDLIVQMRKKIVRPEYLVQIGHIPDLNYINYDAVKGLKIGALTTIRAIERSAELRDKYSILCEAAEQLASVQVRNLATIGGNLCNASPAADMAPALIGLSAAVKIVGLDREKVVLLEDFFTGPGSTVRKTDELLLEFQIPPLPPHTGGVYLKYGRRGATDVAVVGVAAVVTLESPNATCKDAKVVLGSVAPTPMRALKAEQILKGNQIDDALIDKAGQAASEEANPVTDFRASAQYRRQMVKVFTVRAVRAALKVAKSGAR